MGSLSGDLRTPELSDIGIGTGPASDCLAADPDELDVVGVRDVETVVTGLGGEKVESVIKDKSTSVKRAVTIDIDLGARTIVRLGNVGGVVGEPRGNLLVSLGAE